jgi:hypothetical protein
MPKFMRRVREMERIPQGYGVAWRAWDSAAVICAPIGLHLVLGAVRSAYVWFRHLYVPDVAVAIFLRGYDKGREDGRALQALGEYDRLHAAYRQGRDHQMAWLLAGLDIERAERKREQTH